MKYTVTLSRGAYFPPKDKDKDKIKAAKGKASAEFQSDQKRQPNHVSLTCEELAAHIKAGFCVRGALLEPMNDKNTETRNGKKTYSTDKAFIEQGAILLDFDNKAEPLPTLQTADGVRDLVNSKIGQNAVSIVSESWTSSEALRKWHVILLLSEPCGDLARVKAVIKYFLGVLFKGIADPKCKEPARYCLGSTPDKITQSYDGVLDLDALPPQAFGDKQSKTAAPPKYESKKEPIKDTDMTADRLAEIILNSRCDFGADGYGEYLSCCTALYHVAGVSSDDIAAWGSTYDGTQQNPRQWETMNRNGTFTIGTLKKFAEQLNPAAFDAYKRELFERSDFKAHFKPQALDWDGTPEQEQQPAEDQSNGSESAQDQSDGNGTPAELPEIDLDTLTADDFINGTALYEYIGAFYSENGIDEIGLQDYIQQARAHAVKFKCGKAFDGKMKARVLTLKKDDKERRRQKAAERAAKAAAKLPDWVIPTEHGNQIEENIFCQEYLNRNGEMKCITGFFYNVDGLVDMGKIVHDVYDKIQFYIFKDVAQRARKIVDCLSLYTYSAPIAPDLDRIHVNNGTLILNGADFTFEPQKYFCTSRLNVDYVDSLRRPDKWRAFLDDLLDHTDQLTLQEYFGYCLLPTTKAQTALFIIGKGGEGKSVVGAVLKAIFGDTLTAGAVEDLDNGSKARFARVKLVSKLVMLDDDVELAALEKTAFLKQLITARVPSEIEPKGKPSFEALLYARIVAFGNGAISSLYDTSDGFFRRQLILSAKPKDPNRTDDPNIIESILSEKEKIFVWALQGLERLIKNNYKFTVSEQTMQNIEQAKRESNNIIAFMESGRVVIDRNNARYITARELYRIYEIWCYESMEKPRQPRSFTRFLHDNEKKYGIEYSENTRDADGKRARGFIGIGNIHAYTI